MNPEERKEQLLKLIEEKDAIEISMKEMSLILSQNNIGMNEPLVDNDGYPRSDIDVYQVRLARNKIKCLQTDHTAIFKKIETELERVHADEALDPNGVNAAMSFPQEYSPFAVISKVDIGSPSEIDGLQENDLICKFGSVTAENFQSIANVGDVVKLSLNKPIQIIVRRSNKTKAVQLTPRPWGGRGHLGCIINPYEIVDR